MKIVNTRNIPESFRASPQGRFARGNKDVSVALGRNPDSLDLRERLPFDVQICRIPPGKSRCPYHQHTAQWEFFHVLSGAGTVRHAGGQTAVKVGDAFQFGPGEPHALANSGTDDFVLYIVADNPLGDACYYPDSNKWMIEVPGGPVLPATPVDYYAGEE